MEQGQKNKLRAAYRNLSEELYRANIVGEDQRTISDALHVMHVAVYEATRTNAATLRERLHGLFSGLAARFA